MIKELSKTDGADTVVGENVTVVGKLHTSGNIQINGSVEGELSADGIIVIGKTAKISGPINAVNVKVEGEVNGNIVAKNELELESNAKVFGDIKSKTLSIKAGAIFVGRCEMGQEKEVKEEKEEPEPTPQIEIE